ncbi:class I SAM-dependent methyltransferase [Thalassococcus sp. CAU 1522]|uniref:Class I SAM-dependent methyltransferase n=1 Tax=Thalassococcus arenae TaxID=2851652 RepID=A0ABS6N9Y5_9RHOB|nr:methyltransferase domain-containing protein [Thalassococcus arenae]MBV2360815.1 class I SAM-dependent methyltransferase [Thalassococcus arenae]
MASINRIVMAKRCRQLVRMLEPDTLDVAEISGKWGANFGFRSYRAYWYPDYDICESPLRDDAGGIAQFDLIIADQVWEHLDRPYRATQNVLASLRPGGYFLVAVPFFVPLHAAPVDNTRWSARGLRNFLVECGFDEDNVMSEQWGNRWAGLRNAMGPFPPVYNEGHDDLENDENFPVTSWALAQKAK